MRGHRRLALPHRRLRNDLRARSDPELLRGDPDRSAVKAEQRVLVTLYREVTDTPRHVGEVPGERADVGEHSRCRADFGLFNAEARSLELLDRELDVKVVVNGLLESEELVKRSGSRPGLLGDEDPVAAQHAANFNLPRRIRGG